MKIRILDDVRVEHAGRVFLHASGQVLDSVDHPLGARFKELLNSGQAEAVPDKIETAALNGKGDKK